MENNMVIENMETEENLIFDQDEFNEAMDELCRLGWECSQFTTDAEKLAFVQSHKLALTDVILKDVGEKLTDQDKQDLIIIIEEGLVMISKVLNRVSEKTRVEFKEIFLDKKD